MSALARPARPTPILQIVHVSDMHVVGTKHPAAPVVRRLERWAKKIGNKELLEALQDGTAPSDQFAPFFFRTFIDRITVADPTWSKCPTWLVDSGDHTTFGDDPSFSLARKHLSSFLNAAGRNAGNGSLVNLHGNHDAWPEDLPVFQGKRIPAHSTKIAGNPLGYAVGRPQSPLRCTLSGVQEIQLYTLDTVDDDSWHNTWARGRVAVAQRGQLSTLMQNCAGAQGARHLRIVVTHHPVHFPPPRPRYAMVIRNEVEVGTHFATGSWAVHVVLSGHTHALFPGHGKLPPGARSCQHAPLGVNQCQLVVGTLMQIDRFRKRGNDPQQCQVLRFYHDPDSPDVVVMQRLLASRNPNTSPTRSEYEFVPIAGKGLLEEEMLVEL